MTDRASQARAFLDHTPWRGSRQELLAGDASNRRYERVFHPDTGASAVLMDADPGKGENVRPFAAIARHLSAQGLSAPDILAEDPDHGFLLIEDLGDALFARVTLAEPALEPTLYQAATDVLSHLHRAALPPGLATYDSALMTRLAALAFDWYLRGAAEADETAKQAFCAVFEPVLTQVVPEVDVLIQRDYHAENLLWLPERSGVARVGLLDFQDAMRGHRAYDLVSLLQDARRDVPHDIEMRMITHYVAENDLDPTAFDAAYAVLGAQRNLRILGVFARLSLRDGKAHYVNLIPRVWEHLLHDLEHPALAPVAPLVLDILPEPDAPILERLKSLCGTRPTP
ncbi:phosphotransferase [Lutimaribacter sp. EGI FJ00015]|uniref:Phosphotransferase n=1 Tax=Lutimaribacter degradans TaxID=2945989 RepID=A0ACC5ZUY6_9RHOB|nr:phosphotransferase [Lutimaribacter sp. EGI FJ00013]MCM2562000.1 phosphotransferase [Lutimaribacter sp. EGI FJ00013]MCO0612968.1 phosphotransferase [Lutimaribacter sp. EGI FJ00015]MCO0635832.1 phosphotransferase [Lutimaribacter sp. EGI FJ00014]